MNTIVFTLGFDVTSVIARLSEMGLAGKEHLVFVVPESSSTRAIASQKTLENHIAVLNSRGFKLTFEFLKVGEDDAIKAVAKIYNTLSRHENIVVELSGGMRYLIIATFLAAMALRGRVEEVATRLESDGRHIAIPLLEPSPLTSSDARVLEELRFSGLQSQRQLAASIGRRISSISRSLSKLEKMGFVNSSGSHPRSYSISPLGEIFLSDYKTNSKAKVGLVDKRWGESSS
ncbi:MAG: CRISPR-associated CARF protein Csa3 [Nitrososphaerota archaeon]